jgi:hypothetical protein
MQDVAGRIVDQFAGNLATMIGASGAAATAAAAAAAQADSGSPASSAGGAATPAAPRPTIHADDSIDLLGTAGAPVLKRAIPAAIGLVVVVGIIIWIAKR